MYIGIDIGGSHIGVGLITQEYELIDKVEYDLNNYNKNKEDILKMIIEGIERICYNNNITNLEISNIGISSCGTIKNGSIMKAENLNIYNFNLCDKLKEIFDAKISIGNDAKCAVIAEKTIGSLKNYSDIVFLTIGTGIGGAVFLNKDRKSVV